MITLLHCALVFHRSSQYPYINLPLPFKLVNNSPPIRQGRGDEMKCPHKGLSPSMEAAVIMNPEVSVTQASNHPALLLGNGASEPSMSTVIGPQGPITLYICHFSPVSAKWITQTSVIIMINHHHIDDDETCWWQLLFSPTSLTTLVYHPLCCKKCVGIVFRCTSLLGSFKVKNSPATEITTHESLHH